MYRFHCHCRSILLQSLFQKVQNTVLQNHQSLHTSLQSALHQPKANLQIPEAEIQPTATKGEYTIQTSACTPTRLQAGPVAAPADKPWPKAQPDMPKIPSLDVIWEKNFMKVFVKFVKPFYGIIFSKGHYSDVNCVHLPAGLGRTSAKFDLSINSCGTIGNTGSGLYGYGADSGSGTFFENTIVVNMTHRFKKCGVKLGNWDALISYDGWWTTWKRGNQKILWKFRKTRDGR